MGQRNHTSLCFLAQCKIHVALKMIILKSQVELLLCTSSEKNTAHCRGGGEGPWENVLRFLVFVAGQSDFLFPQPNEQVTVAVISQQLEFLINSRVFGAEETREYF